jgi:hypothetical protein
MFIGYGFLSLAHFLCFYVWIATGVAYSTSNLTPWLVVTFGAVCINVVICRAIFRGQIPSPPQDSLGSRNVLRQLCVTLVTIPLAIFVLNLLVQICLAAASLFSETRLPSDDVEALIIQLPLVLFILSSSIIIAHGIVGAKSLLSGRMIRLLEILEGFPFNTQKRVRESQQIVEKGDGPKRGQKVGRSEKGSPIKG